MAGRHPSPQGPLAGHERGVLKHEERTKLPILLQGLRVPAEAFLAEVLADVVLYDRFVDRPSFVGRHRRPLRRARHKTLMEISVILARIGEIALLQTLEKVPFDRKLEGLRAYLKEAKGTFAQAP